MMMGANMTKDRCRNGCHMIKKRVCVSCGSAYCSQCLNHPNCTSCKKLLSGKFTRRDLQRYTVRELRHFLQQRAVSVVGCHDRNDFEDELLKFSISDEHLRDESVTSDNVYRVVESEDQTSQTVQQNVDTIAQQSEVTEQSKPGPVQSELPQQQRSTEEVSTKRVIRLSDIHDRTDISSLATAELRSVIATSYLSAKGCVEKSDLVHLVQQLWDAEHSVHKEEDTCRVCMDAPMDCVLLDCGHMATCNKCARQLAECPLCRRYVVRTVRVFKA